MATFSIRVEGDKELARKIEAGLSELNDFSSSMREIGQDVTEYVEDKVFASQGAVLGSRWPRLNPEYARHKAEEYGGTGTLTLIRTGTMRRSFSFKSGKDFMTLRNFAPYFEYHQNGRGVPQRVMLAVNGEIERMAVKSVKADVDAAIERMGIS